MSLRMLDLIKANALNSPDALAIKCGEQAVTYRELLANVAKSERLLRDQGMDENACIALLLGPSIRLICLMIACASIGATYIPLDPKHQSERVDTVLAMASPNLIIAASAEHAGFIFRTGAAKSAFPENFERPLYVIFTSGTTGVPKGVCIPPSSLDALFDATFHLFDFSPNDRWLLAHSPAFDFSVWEIWMPLALGASLIVPDADELRIPQALVALLEGEKITVLNQTPTAFSALTRFMSVAHAFPNHLRYIIFGGERLLPQQLRTWVAARGLSSTKLVNMYGITEVTVHATFHEITAHDLSQRYSSIGFPLPGFDWRVGGFGAQQVSEGELFLSGPQIASGYLNDRKATDKSFLLEEGKVFYATGDVVRDMGGGNFQYIGRRDRQVKVSGYRIELAEIEHAISTCHGVAEVFAFVESRSSGARFVVCAYTPSSEARADPSSVRTHALNKLAYYMVPSEFICFPELPLNINGKVDAAQVQAMWRQFRKANTETRSE